jgi:hypothetical protein
VPTDAIAVSVVEQRCAGLDVGPSWVFQARSAEAEWLRAADRIFTGKLAGRDLLLQQRHGIAAALHLRLQTVGDYELGILPGNKGPMSMTITSA